MKIKCAIVDDEPLARGLLESYARKTPSLEVAGVWASAVQAAQEMRGRDVDLLFLDIQMPELNGLDYSRMVEGRTRVVFTTAFGEYAVEGFRVNALDYLVKPISYADFMRAVGKAAEWFELQRTPREEATSIFLKSDYKMVQVRLDDILYIEGLKDYVKVYEAGQPRPLLSLSTLKWLEDVLPQTRFMRVHRSYIVQMSKVRVVDRWRIVFGDAYVPIGDSYRDAFQRFMERGGR